MKAAVVLVADLVPHPSRIRSDLGPLDELTASIRAVGLLQPLLVSARPGQKVTVIDGVRRTVALQNAKVDKALCLVLEPGRERHVADLTPTEDLILEVLAARVRCGESCWVFERRHRPALRSLETKGLLTFGVDPTGTALRAFLTDAGRAECLTDGYIEPVTRLREQLAENARTLELTQDARRGEATRNARLQAENHQLRDQLDVAVAHLGGVSDPAAVDDLLWHRDVLVLHTDGTTTAGRLGLVDGQYVVDRPSGPVHIDPVGFTATDPTVRAVDIVRPVAVS